MTYTADSYSSWLQRYPRLATMLDPNVTDADLDRVLESLLEESIRYLEDNANLYASLNEEQLSGLVVMALRRDGIRVDPEVNVNGHVDLRIEFDHSLPPRRRLAEAKCWDGPKYHADGIAQLLGYMTGREGSGYVLDYVKAPNIAQKWAALKAYLDNNLPASQEGSCRDGASSWTLESRHSHPSGMSVRIVHYGINLGR